MNIRTTLTSCVIVAGLAACTDENAAIRGDQLPITRAEVADTSVANVRVIARTLWETQGWLADSDGVSSIADVLGVSSETTEPEAFNTATQLFLPNDELDFGAWLDDAEASLREHVFAASQVESESTTEVVYLLDKDVFCDPAWEDAFTTCQEVLTALEVRVRVVSFAAHDLDASVLVGPDRKVAMRVELHRDLASVELMLDQVTRIFQAILDTQGDAQGVGEVNAHGAARVAVRVLAERQVRFSAEVTQPITLSADNGDEALSFEAAEGSVALDVDADAQGASADIDLGRVAFSGPKSVLDLFYVCESVSVDADGNETYGDCSEEDIADFEDDEPELEGTIGFTLGRFAALIELDDNAQRFALTGLVFGPLTVTADLSTIIEFTLGHAAAPVDIAVGFDADDALEISFSHSLDLGLLLRLGLAPDLFDEEGSWMADDDLGATLAGTTPELSLTGRGVVVSSGSLTLTSRHARISPLVISEASCAYYAADEVVDDAEEPVQSHPFDFEVADTCPAEEELTTDTGTF